MNKTHKIILLVIFLVSLLFRTYRLDTIPNGFHVDELDAGYIGRYILENGRDISGTFLPLYYNKFGDYRPTGIFYLAGLSVKLFGSTPLATRLPAAFIGALTVIPIYLLSMVLFRSNFIALSTSLLLALSPWHIVLSRATSEGIVGLFILFSGLSIALLGLEHKKRRYILFGQSIMMLSYFFYHPFRIITPLYIGLLLFHPNFPTFKKSILIGLFFSIILTFFFSFFSAGTGRLSQVAFYTNPLVATKIDTLLASEGTGHIVQARIFHNKGIIFLRELIVQYCKYFSSEYLFVNGGLPFRYSVQEQGLLPIISLPLFVAGIFGIIKREKRWLLLFTFGLLITAPIPAALTYEDTPNVHRSLTMVLPFMLIAGYGMHTIYSLYKNTIIKKILIFLILSVLIAETAYFWHQYFVHSPSLKPFYRQDGYLEVAKFITSNEKRSIYITGFEHMPLYILFSQNNYSYRKFNQHDTILLNKLGNITFIRSWCFENKNSEKNTVIINGPNCAKPDNANPAVNILRKDSTVAFTIYTP